MRKMSKYFITAFVLTVLMAIFAFSANAKEYVVTDTSSYNAAMASIAKGDVVIVSGTVEVPAGTLKKSITIKGDSSDGVADKLVLTGSASLLELQSSCTLTLEDITIDGNSRNRLFYINGGSTLILNEGTVLTGGYRSSGHGAAVFIGSNGVCIMNGGTMTNNTGASGSGAVYVGKSGKFVMNGGSITANKGTNGGGIYALGGSILEMHAGSITNNATTASGGGIWLPKDTTANTRIIWNTAMICSGNTQSNGATSTGCNVNISNGGNANFDVTAVAEWSTKEDIDALNNQFVSGVDYMNFDRYVVKVNNDITYGARIKFNATMPVEVVGNMAGGTPTLTWDKEGNRDTSFLSTNASGQVTLKDIIIDVDYYNAGETPSGSTELRAIYMNSSTKLVLDSGAVIKGGYRNDNSGGGVFISSGSTLTMNEGSLITECHGKSGGAIYVGGTFIMNGGSITNCTEAGGDGAGGVYVGKGTTFTMNGGTISGCSAGNHGGAIFNWQGTTTITGGTISDNTADMGGAIRNYGTLNISGGTISGNTGNGVITSTTGPVNISGTTVITNNKGGGIDRTGGVYILSGDFYMSGGTISDNVGGNRAEGGGIRIADSGTVSITGGTISGNYSGYGAGIYVAEGNEITLTDVTITGNDAEVKGGGLYIGSSVATAKIGGNTTITDNTLKGTTVCNIQTATGFRSYDDEVYAGNNWPNGWIVIDSAFTGDIGLYYLDTMPIGMQVVSINVGVITENGSVSGTISNDNGKFVYAQGTDAKGNACITMTAVETVDFVIKFANGGSQTFTVAKLDKYILPDAEDFVAPEGYDADDLIGLVKVSGYGTLDAKAEKFVDYESAFVAEDLENLYAVWVKVNTLAAASANISENSGLRFVTTVDSGVLANVGLNAKAEGTEGNGYIRGMVLGTSATDMSENLGVNHCKLNKVIANDGWMTAEKYNQYTKQTLADGQSAYAFTLTYSNEENYNKAVAFRGYIVITVGEQKVWIYSEFKNPGTMTDSDDATYGNVHARSARAVVRNVYFKGDYQTKEDVIAKIGESNYAIALKIAGLEEFAILPKNSL